MWYVLLIAFLYFLKDERDKSRTNFEGTVAYRILPFDFINKHKKWFTNNNWDDTNLFFVDPKNKYEWDNFIVKNVLTFLNDYWKFCEFFLMLAVCFMGAMLSGYWWLTLPYFIIFGTLHSISDGSFFRRKT